MRIGLLVVAVLALIGFLVVAVVLPQMQGAELKEAAEALVADVQITPADARELPQARFELRPTA